MNVIFWCSVKPREVTHHAGNVGNAQIAGETHGKDHLLRAQRLPFAVYVNIDPPPSARLRAVDFGHVRRGPNRDLKYGGVRLQKVCELLGRYEHGPRARKLEVREVVGVNWIMQGECI
jgi:hypothetical protein